MKAIKLFYLENCPYCRQARAIMEELLKNPKYQGLEITMIEESRQKELADQYDYYYVPTFYVEEEKICEGILTEKEILEVLERAL